MDVVNAQLVEECARRLARVVTDFSVPADALEAMAAAARMLASARPLDRGSILIRAERRLQSLRSAHTGEAVVHAEREFQLAVEETLVALMDKLGRPFVWEPRLAVRVVLDTYERSFESWLLRGGSEADFVASSFVHTTLPHLLEELSTRRPAEDPARTEKQSTGFV
ncbi:hypothetical protein [Microbacterium allomyrinae]|uniref:Uncharacterized protein n=1 Tax=Microbacterium allomyrinae TaxID=2830666 RepID=A0A9X1S4M8_9MICO|nr:hypothetical protein [Microbacterium allomyrinae]MCC2033165.1 hypothetical protein [Microbacterium allomyrinae]